MGTIDFTPIEIDDHWTTEQQEEAKKLVSFEDTMSEDQEAAFKYWESIRNDDTVSTEEKARAMAECMDVPSFERRGDWMGTVDSYDKLYVKLQELYPRPDVNHTSEEINSKVSKLSQGGDVVSTVTVTSQDGKTKVRITYVNGKRERFDAIHQNETGDSTRITKTYESDGETVKSNTEKITNADGSTTTTTTNYEDGRVQSESTNIKDTEGNYQSSEKNYNQDGDVTSEVRGEGDKNGNFTSKTYKSNGDLLISHERSVDEDGNITDTYKGYKPDGSVNSETIMTRRPDGTSSYIMKDGDGNIIGSSEEPSDPSDPSSPPSTLPPGSGPGMKPIEEPPPPPRADPLVLDLGGDGIITTGLDAGIHFDHDGDGFKELSGFVNSDDGLLVLDRNEDGSINDGNELFGDNTKLIDGSIAQHGFAALSEFDDQKDGKIDKTDAIFEKLRIFQDFNQNGEVNEGELFSLEEKKIASLNLT